MFKINLDLFVFQIFYPDLIEKTQTPEYTIVSIIMIVEFFDRYICAKNVDLDQQSDYVIHSLPFHLHVLRHLPRINSEFGVSDQVQHKLDCLGTEYGQKLEI